MPKPEADRSSATGGGRSGRAVAAARPAATGSGRVIDSNFMFESAREDSETLIRIPNGMFLQKFPEWRGLEAGPFFASWKPRAIFDGQGQPS